MNKNSSPLGGYSFGVKEKLFLHKIRTSCCVFRKGFALPSKLAEMFLQ